MLGFGKTALIRATTIYRGIRRLSIRLVEMLSNPYLEFAIGGFFAKVQIAISAINRGFYRYELHSPVSLH